MDSIVSFFDEFSSRPTPKDPGAASQLIQAALRQLDQIPKSPVAHEALRDSLLQAREITHIWKKELDLNGLNQLSNRLDQQINFMQPTPQGPIHSQTRARRVQAVIDYVNANWDKLFSKLYLRKEETGLDYSFQIVRGAEPAIVIHTNEKNLGKGWAMLTRRCHMVGKNRIQAVAKQTVLAQEKAPRIERSLYFLRLLQGKEGIIQLKGYAIYPNKKTGALKTNLILEEASEDMTNKKPKNVAERHQWEFQLLKGLSNIHALGVIHYDIKRANLFMTERGPVIGDFDLAQYESDKPRVKGTIRYFSPEITYAASIKKQSRWAYQKALANITKKTDVYSLGLVFYQWKYNVDLSKYSPEEVREEIENWWNETITFNDPEEELIRQMLEDHPSRRITSAEALDHARFSFNFS